MLLYSFTLYADSRFLTGDYAPMSMTLLFCLLLSHCEALLE